MSDYTWFEGIPFPAFWFSKEILENSCKKFVVKEDDLIILTYPKSGTNWLIEIVCLIQTKGDPKWIQSMPIWDRSPWIETGSGYDKLTKMEGPRLMTSHLPMHLFSKSLFSSKAKNKLDYQAVEHHTEILGALRKNVKYHTRTFRNYMFAYGSWFEHIRGWLSMREWDNFLVLYYEDMKKDTMGSIKKICDFLGKKLEPDELNLVLKYSSFQVVKENNMSNYSLMEKELILTGFTFMRKGTTNDWKNHFTVAQAEAFDKVFQEKMAGFPPGMFPWE
ncbi:alcohol sulfotransferase-like [Rattus norvegicus]|uniref:alcohol sulfotransferase-like n=1 Tax=Rattus norvegicus TaxID=10116 RepID=UPI002FD7ECF1